MGDPKFSRRKFDTPSHPWEGERITEENEMLKKFGLKNKRELWKAHSMLKNFRGQARSLVARSRYGDTQAAKETKWLLDRLVNMGLLESMSTLDDVLALDVLQVLNRRLQTVAYHKGLAQTPKQARQLIVHGHIAIKGGAVTIPSYFVKKDEEEFITYHSRSPLMHDMHPARPKPKLTDDVQAPPALPKKQKKAEEKAKAKVEGEAKVDGKKKETEKPKAPEKVEKPRPDETKQEGKPKEEKVKTEEVKKEKTEDKTAEKAKTEEVKKEKTKDKTAEKAKEGEQ